jgi:mono/diheme cytochrome c family protein
MRASGLFVTGGAMLAAVGVLAACMQRDPPVSGQALFQQNCAVCHGTGGRGDGPAAAGRTTPLPDLTTLAARNDGVFPLRAVMTHIDGYGRGARVGSEDMPEMGHLLVGAVVRVDTGDGILTPTPVKLLALAEYIETLQE